MQEPKKYQVRFFWLETRLESLNLYTRIYIINVPIEVFLLLKQKDFSGLQTHPGPHKYLFKHIEVRK